MCTIDRTNNKKNTFIRRQRVYMKEKERDVLRRLRQYYQLELVLVFIGNNRRAEVISFTPYQWE